MVSFLLILFVAVIAAGLFTLWVIVSGTRSLWRLIAGPGGGGQASIDSAAGPRCRNSGCGTVNPPQAQFCRRCGSAMAQRSSIPMPTDRPQRVA